MRRVLQVVVLMAAQALAFDLLSAVDETKETDETSKDEPKIYECENANGDVVYQDDPCADPPQVRAKPPRVSKSAKGQKGLPIKQSTSSANPTASTEHQESPKPGWVVVPRSPTPSSTPPRPAPAHRGGSADARWQTPRKTLKTFVEAVSAGDRPLVWECLTSTASNALAPEAASLPLENLKETIDSFTGYVDEGDLGPFWSIRALRSGTRPKWILFERTRAGEWKISGI